MEDDRDAIDRDLGLAFDRELYRDYCASLYGELTTGQRREAMEQFRTARAVHRTALLQDLEDREREQENRAMIEYADGDRAERNGYPREMVRAFCRKYGSSKVDFERRLKLERAKAKRSQEDGYAKLELLKKG